jgi:parallel beta-helix repeat protein
MKVPTIRRPRPVLPLAVTATGIAVLLGFGGGQAGAATVVCGQVITQSTHVGNDLVNCPGDGLIIGANNIRLNLGGHTIDGVNNPGTAGIRNTGGWRNVEVVHGKVQQFSNGLLLADALRNKLKHLRVSQNSMRGIGLVLSDDSEIEHNRVFNNFDGIHLDRTDRAEIEHDDVFRNRSSGIVLITGSDDNKVAHNRSHDHTAWGITGDGDRRNVYAHNKVYRNGNAGIEQFNSTNMVFSRNKAFRNRRGIVLTNTDNSVVKKNKIRSNTTFGSQVGGGSTGNLLLKNRSDRNGVDGIRVDNPGNTITKNRANRNGKLGIFAAAGNVDGGGNKARHNGNPLQCSGVSCS